MKKKMMLAALMNLSLIAAISGNAIAAETDDVIVEMMEEIACDEVMEEEAEEICIEVAEEDEEQEEVILEAEEVEEFAEEILNSTGLLELSFVPVDASSKDIHNGWKLTLLDENGKEIDKQSSVKTFYQFNKLPFKAGSIFYVKVESSAATKSYVATAPYVLKANFVTPQNWEKEKNDSVNQANEIGVNDIAYGTIYTSKDVDYYKINAGVGALNISLNADNSNKDELIKSGWKLPFLMRMEISWQRRQK